MSDPIYVIGHKNPDADSICAAIAYADFKNKLTQSSDYVAARCGNSNARIDAILDYFNMSLPLFIGDVTPRLRDIMISDVRSVKTGATCIEALEVIDEFDVRSVPVVEEDGSVKGLLSIFQMGEFFIPKIREPFSMRRVVSSVQAIINSIDAKILNSNKPDEVEEMFVRVGAMDIRSFGTFTEEEKIPAEQSIIVVGDRYDIQSKSIYSGVRLLVITGGLDVDPEIVELAKEKGVNLIISPYDSATTAWTIRSATLVKDMVDTKFTKFGPEETVKDVRRRTAMINSPIYFVMDDKDRMLGIFSKTDLLRPTKSKIILVDHNEVGQAVNGASEVNILEIIDHHRLGNTPTSQPILFINEPVGSSCTIVADQYQRFSIQPSPEIAGIMMSGIISDTLHLNSPTSTAKDKEILSWLAGIADVESNELSQTIFNAGSIIVSNTPEEVITADQKMYCEGEISYSVSQVEELGMENFWEKKDILLQALKDFRKQEDLYMATLLVTDINSQNSLLLVAGEREFLERISYPIVESNCIFDLPGIVSRKKQLIPYLTGILEAAPA
ncbi:putative manganese-dependent inorganic diphosphatase [Opitutia bacterium ISCC 51]|nr:putative manganese-dependent inorganic diphosphatase [Opitutae bacterium ISCC 51]QXD26493.1 putative manganese-dependent inorganic diphosphatase [Opitutae bacterium ISCC 52]